MSKQAPEVSKSSTSSDCQSKAKAVIDSQHDRDPSEEAVDLLWAYSTLHKKLQTRRLHCVFQAGTEACDAEVQPLLIRTKNYSRTLNLHDGLCAILKPHVG